jgi:hypothetical protein
MRIERWWLAASLGLSGELLSELGCLLRLLLVFGDIIWCKIKRNIGNGGYIQLVDKCVLNLE